MRATVRSTETVADSSAVVSAARMAEMRPSRIALTRFTTCTSSASVSNSVFAGRELSPPLRAATSTVIAPVARLTVTKPSLYDEVSSVTTGARSTLTMVDAACSGLEPLTPSETPSRPRVPLRVLSRGLSSPVVTLALSAPSPLAEIAVSASPEVRLVPNSPVTSARTRLVTLPAVVNSAATVGLVAFTRNELSRYCRLSWTGVGVPPVHA